MNTTAPPPLDGDETSAAVWIASIIIYGIVWLFLIGIFCSLDPKKNNPKLVSFFLLLSLLLRLLWLGSKAQALEGDEAYFFRFVSRLSLLTQLTAITVMLMAWQQAMDSMKKAQRMGYNLKLLIFVVVLNLATYGLILGTTPPTREGEEVGFLYKVNQAIIAWISLVVVGGGALYYGYELIEVFKLSTGNAGGALQSFFIKIRRISFAVFICYLVRAFLMIAPAFNDMQPIGGVAGKILYPWFFYHFPELVPAVIIMWSYLPEDSKIARCLTRNNEGHSSVPDAADDEGQWEGNPVEQINIQAQ